MRTDTSCTGTLLAPDLVLTAAHCAQLQLPDLVFADGGRTGRVGECFIHPNALRPSVGSCVEFRDRTSSVLDTEIEHDVMVLRLQAPLTGVAPRTFGPPRACLASDEATAQPVLRHRGWVVDRMALAPVRAFYDGLFLRTPDNPISAGDSGGTIDAFLDPGGPVIGANSQLNAPFAERHPILWQHDAGLGGDARNIDWVWSVLDPDGYCRLGSTSPCVPARYPIAFSDSDGDGLPDARDLCPHDVPVRVCDGQHCDADLDWLGDECDAFDGIDGSSGAPNAELAACDHDDPDHDGLPSGADPCPRVHASATDTSRDEDGDGVPDACDVCPSLDDATVDFALDGDVDGVPNACDGCPTAPDRLQLDCNLDAELAAWAVACPPGPTGEPSCPRTDFVHGDACDPTPCGETRVTTEVVGARATEEVVQAALRVDARASVERGARTGFRFCRCRFATRDSLEQRIGCRALDELITPEGVPFTLGGWATRCGHLRPRRRARQLALDHNGVRRRSSAARRAPHTRGAASRAPIHRLRSRA